MTFPVALQLQGLRCLVVGSGKEASERVAALERAGALVRCVLAEAWTEQSLDEVWLVVLTDRDTAQAQLLRTACDARRTFFCAIDQPAFNTFNHMALVEEGPVTVAISTGGRAPLLARRLKLSLQRVFRAGGLAEFAERIAALRERLPRERRKVELERVLVGFDLEGELRLPREDLDSEH